MVPGLPPTTTPAILCAYRSLKCPQRAPSAVEPISEGRLLLCPSCGLDWKPWRNAPPRKYVEYLDRCAKCYDSATAKLRRRDRRLRSATRAAGELPKTSKRATAPWLLRFSHLYQGQRVPQPHSHNSRLRWEHADPVSAGGASHPAVHMVPNLGRQVGRGGII